MAPLRNLPGDTAQPLKSILKKTVASSPAARAESLFQTSKKDKRRIKHAQLMSKVTKPTTKPRRRRPNKKLVATLDSLADALPDADGRPDGSGAVGTKSDVQVNIIQRKSMKSRPGAMKRRERVDKTERDRFAKNMAQMGGKPSNEATIDSAQAASGASQWAALRGFISQTLEQRQDIKIAP